MNEDFSNVTDPAALRRLRRRQRVRRGIYLLPHLFTTANLFWGYYAIIKATTGEYFEAGLGIVLAAVFDLFDGRVARMAGVESEFGAEYDSLADLIAFGVAPSILAMHAGNLLALERLGWVVAFLFTVCAALRLARFNVTTGPYKGWFEGLPSPAAGGMVAASVWFFSFLDKRGIDLRFDGYEWFLAAGVVMLGLLMVSPIPFRSSKELHLRQSFPTLVIAVVCFAVIMIRPTVTLFALGAIYILSGPVEWIWRKATGRTLAELAELAQASALEEESS